MSKSKILIKENSGYYFNCSNQKNKSLVESLALENGSLMLKGIPATILDKENLNGRIYSSKQMVKSLEEVKSKGYFEKRVLTCTADDHPDTSFVKPSNSSHVVVNAYVKEVNGQSMLLNDILILDTFQGKNLQALIKDGVSVGTSIRGMGIFNESTKEVEEYEYLGTDIVGQPSAGTYIEHHNIEVVIEKRKNNLVSESMENKYKIEELEKEILGSKENEEKEEELHIDLDGDNEEGESEEHKNKVFDKTEEVEEEEDKEEKEEEEFYDENTEKEWDINPEEVQNTLPLPEEGEVEMNKPNGEDQPKVEHNTRIKARGKLNSEIVEENNKLSKKYNIALQLIEQMKSTISNLKKEEGLEDFIKKSISATESLLKKIDEKTEQVTLLSSKNKKLEEQNSKLKNSLITFSVVSNKVIESMKKVNSVKESKEYQYFNSLGSLAIRD